MPKFGKVIVFFCLNAGGLARPVGCGDLGLPDAAIGFDGKGIDLCLELLFLRVQLVFECGCGLFLKERLLLGLFCHQGFFFGLALGCLDLFLQ